MLWPPCVADADIIFSSCGFFFFLSSFFISSPNLSGRRFDVYHPTTLSGYIFATKACIDNRKKLVKQQCFSTCSCNVVNFCPLAAEIVSLVWGTLANFNGFRVLASLLQRCRLGWYARFNRIRQVAPMCPPIRAHWRHLANTIELVLPSAYQCPQPKRQIDRFSRFWATFVKRFALCYRLLSCLPCLSCPVCLSVTLM